MARDGIRKTRGRPSDKTRPAHPRRQARQARARERQEYYDGLSLEQKIARDPGPKVMAKLEKQHDS